LKHTSSTSIKWNVLNELRNFHIVELKKWNKHCNKKIFREESKVKKVKTKLSILIRWASIVNTLVTFEINHQQQWFWKIFYIRIKVTQSFPFQNICTRKINYILKTRPTLVNAIFVCFFFINNRKFFSDNIKTSFRFFFMHISMYVCE
jgi:hypothetical protein